MNYLDFVDRVLVAIDATVKAGIGEYAMPVSMLEVGKQIVGSESPEVDPARFHNSPLHRGLMVASRDLYDMGLVSDDNSHHFRLTPNGRIAAAQGLRREWPDIVENFHLSDESRELLTVLCDLSEKEYEEFAELYLNDWDAISAALPGIWTHGKLVGTWKELEQRRSVSGALVSGGVSHARPTYIGFVLARIGPHARLIQLVEELVKGWEGASVEHKVRLEVGGEKQKAELARDVAALANTQVRGERYLVIGFDNTSHSFAESFDSGIDQDRLEDILGTRLSDIPPIQVHLVPWPGGTVGLVEVGRQPAKLPYTISRDLTDKIHIGDVFVRHGSHVANADDEEVDELKAERKRALGDSTS